MIAPVRLQLSRRKGFNLKALSRATNGLEAVVVTRGPGKKYGNRHRIGYCPICGISHTREEAVAEFRAELNDLPGLQELLDGLRNKNIACACRLDECCHGDVWLEIANK